MSTKLITMLVEGYAFEVTTEQKIAWDKYVEKKCQSSNLTRGQRALVSDIKTQYPLLRSYKLDKVKEFTDACFDAGMQEQKPPIPSGHNAVAAAQPNSGGSAFQTGSVPSFPFHSTGMLVDASALPVNGSSDDEINPDVLLPSSAGVTPRPLSPASSTDSPAAGGQAAAASSTDSPAAGGQAAAASSTDSPAAGGQAAAASSTDSPAAGGQAAAALTSPSSVSATSAAAVAGEVLDGIVDKDAEIARLKEEVRIVTELNQKYSNTLQEKIVSEKEQLAKITQLQNEKGGIESRIRILETESGRKDTTIVDLRTRLTEKDKLVDQLRQEVIEVNLSCTSKLTQKDENIQKLQEKIGNLKKEPSVNFNAIKDKADADAKKQKEAIQRLTSEIQQREGRISHLEKEKRELVSENQGLNSRVTDLTTENQGLNSRVTNLTTENQGLNSRVTDLTTENQGLNSRVTKLTSDIQTLTKERDDLQASIQQASAVSDFSGISSQITTGFQKVERHVTSQVQPVIEQLTRIEAHQQNVLVSEIQKNAEFTGRLGEFVRQGTMEIAQHHQRVVDKLDEFQRAPVLVSMPSRTPTLVFETYDTEDDSKSFDPSVVNGSSYVSSPSPSVNSSYRTSHPQDYHRTGYQQDYRRTGYQQDYRRTGYQQDYRRTGYQQDYGCENNEYETLAQLKARCDDLKQRW